MTRSERALLGAARAAEARHCRAHPAYFVENYCRLEDRDTPGLYIPFRLWPAQRAALAAFAEHRLTIALKARQLGLTWLALCCAVHQMLFFPGATVIALSRTEMEAGELNRRVGVILGGLRVFLTPERRPEPGKARFKRTALGCEILFDSGLVSSFRAMPSAPGAVRSFTASLLILDEWAYQQAAREIWVSAYPAVNRPTGGRVIGLSTMARGTLFEELYTGDNGFYKLFLPWSADPRRDQGWYEETRAQLGDLILQEYPATVEEALSSPGGAFFPELKEMVHVKEPEAIPADCRRYVALDYGLDMLAACWVYVDHQGFERVYREVYQPGLIVSEAARLLLRENGGEPVYQWLAPPDLWNRNRDTGKSTADIFREHGVPLTRVSNDRHQGWLDLKEHLRPFFWQDEQTGEGRPTAQLTFERGAAPETWRCLRAIQKDPRDPRDAAREPHELTHAPDALRYFAAGRPRPRATPEGMVLECSFAAPRRDKPKGPSRGYIYGR